MPHDGSLLVRFLAKLVLDILPAALASVIGGFLFTQYHSGHTVAPRPVVEQVSPASAEMMQLVRDEHAMIVDYLKTQMAAEKTRLAAENEDSERAAADAKAEATAATRRVAAAAIAARSAAMRSKPPVAAVTVPAHAPLVIAQAAPNDSAVPVDSPPRDPNSLLSKTLDIKDQVIDATLHVVSAIGSIPSWIASMGDRIGGQNASSSSASRLVSASW